jgi:hypothetical protein
MKIKTKAIAKLAERLMALANQADELKLTLDNGAEVGSLLIGIAMDLVIKSKNNLIEMKEKA